MPVHGLLPVFASADQKRFVEIQPGIRKSALGTKPGFKSLSLKPSKINNKSISQMFRD